MKRLPRVATIVAATATTVTLAVSLSACSSDRSAEAEAQSPVQQVTAAASTNTDAATDAAKAPDAEADDSARSGATVPDGYTLTEIPDADLSIAIPSTWTVATGAELADSESAEAIASALGYTTETVQALSNQLSIFAVDAGNTSTAGENISVQTTPGTSLLGESDLSAALAVTSTQPGVNVEPGTFSEVTTGSGDDASMYTYTMTMDSNPGRTIHGAYIAVLDNSGQSVVINVASHTSTRVTDLSDAVIGSI
ncbi:hypothetical protein [Actinomyces sp. 565]|uniref:hypothetical protein n=1 Tax=Actinomyces sp. 565 TaxID=2057794 RepID=UPI0013A6D6DB|nr:hypothetical protein [Actinomyces sp. 565]NDR53030.1 hypothetical protein [Actinomyces sp. 565]